MATTSWDRRGEVRAALRAVVSDPDYGVAALSSPQMMSGLLKDLLPDAPREAGVLVAAAEARLADVLRDHRVQGMDAGTACALAERTFAARTAFTPEACRWVVGELAAAVGFGVSGEVAAGAPADCPPPRAVPPSPAVPHRTVPPQGGAPGTELARDRQPTITAAGPAGPAAGLAAPAGQAEAAGPVATPGRHRVAGRRKILMSWAAGIAVVAVVAGGLIWHFATSTPHADVYSGSRYGFAYPRSIAVGGGHVWVANSRSVTELDVGDGRWVQTLPDGDHGIDAPEAVVADGTDVWVANSGNSSVTELDAGTGRWVRTLSGGSYSFGGPAAMAAGGGHVWVANSGNSSVTELDAGTGRWVQTLSGGSYGFDAPTGIAVGGGHVWVANWGTYGGPGRSVTELDAGTGRWVRTLSGGSYGFNFNAWVGIAVGGGHVWVANQTGSSVTELDASTGRWVATLSGGSYGFSGGPVAIAAGGGHVWVANATGAGGQGSVTELDASTGHLTRNWSGHEYRLNNPRALTAFNNPYALAVDGVSLWVANWNAGTVAGGSVTEVPAG